METREWYERSLKQAEQRGQLRTMVQMCAIRLGRSLTEADSAALAERLDRLGDDRVAEVVMTSSPDALARWLADPTAP